MSAPLRTTLVRSLRASASSSGSSAGKRVLASSSMLASRRFNLTPSRSTSHSFSTSSIVRSDASRPAMAAAAVSHQPMAPGPAPGLFPEARDPWASDPIISYDEVKKLSEQPSDNILLIDVREPDEVALGTIPSAVNLPLSRIDEVLSTGYNPGAFQNEFAFGKPVPKQNIIFFCRSGKRSAVANEVANRHGYLNTRNYVGSWLEWCEKEGIDNNED